MHKKINPSTDQFEMAAAQQLGRLLFVFGSIELNVGLLLIHAAPPSEAQKAANRVEQLRFWDKLQELHALIHAAEASDLATRRDWDRWFASAQGLRELRNRFAHGRWGFNTHLGIVAHAEGLPGSSTTNEMRLSMAELVGKVDTAVQARQAFFDLHPRLARLLG